MRRTHRLPQRLIRCTGFALGLCLIIVAPVVATGERSLARSSQGQRRVRKVGDPLPRKQKASRDSSAADSERAVSDDARVNGMAVLRGHTLTARSLSVAHRTELALPNLMRIESLRGLGNHSLFDFLRYPALHSESPTASVSAMHSGLNDSEAKGTEMGDNVNLTNLELFVAGPLPQSTSAKIAFASNREGSMQIYVMNDDGSNQVRLTVSGANDDFPRWSPDGAKILFQSDRDNPESGNSDIYVMNADGSGVVRLTSDPNDDSMAAWSPDGSKIVFQSMRNGANYQIYSMNANGSNQVNLANTASSEVKPSWSPDGAKIAFASDRDHSGYSSIYLMSYNGSNQQRLTFSSGDIEDSQPAWSRDGSRIAFVSTRDSTTKTWQETDDDGNYITRSQLRINKEIYVMIADGSGQTRLTHDLGNDDSPSWSFDGLTILFRSDRERDCCDPASQVWLMNADGSGQTDLTNSNTGDYSPSLGLAFPDITMSPRPPTAPPDSGPPVSNPGGPYSAQSGQVIQLNGSGSFDPNGTIVSYSWNFGDGTSGTGSIVNHQYQVAGTYPVSLAVTDNSGNTSTSEGSVTIDSVAFPVKINFDELPNNFPIGDHYLSNYGVRFYSDNQFVPVHTWQTCGPCSSSSPPNFVWTSPNITAQMIVEFSAPVSNLSFYVIGLDVFFDQFAVLDVYRNNAPYAAFPMTGAGTSTRQFSLGALDNITKIVIRGITDPAGIGFDDFAYTMQADVKITSGRVSGYLNGTTKNALVGADIALNASALPGAFSGGTYSWTCAPVNLCSIIQGPNSSSVTLRSLNVGTITANVSYTKSGLTSTATMTINSVLPTLTNFTAVQTADRVSAPYTCGDDFGHIFWRYALGCPKIGQLGISFVGHIQTNAFISDGSQSRVKFVQAVSTFRKRMERGMRCQTRRASESNVASGWQLDTQDPYGGPDRWVDFSGVLALQFPMTTDDNPSNALTVYTNWQFVDALYVDDRFEMYLVYYSTNPGIPSKPLGKIKWSWGGLVVFDWNGTDAIHTLRSSNTAAPVFESTNSMVTMNGNVEGNPDVPCPGGPALTDNPIDSSRVFVRAHYLDFLRRKPEGDENANPPQPVDLHGWNFWTSNIAQCVFNLTCIEVQRVHTGLAFFNSQEFMQRIIAEDPIMANGPGTPAYDPPVYNRRFVYWCYMTYLQRNPENDLPGWDFWTIELNKNNDYFNMIKGFQASYEYRVLRGIQ